MYTRILVPVDGSAFAEEVLPHVAALARTLDATITLLCVADRYRELAEAQDYVEALAEKWDAAPLAVAAHGEVSAAIKLEADRVPGTLTAISARGRSGVGTAMLGSVARQYVQSSGDPVLVYRPDGETAPVEAITTVVLPLDGSRRAEQMQAQAAGWAKVLGAQLVIVQVLEEGMSISELLADHDIADDSYVHAHAFEVARDHGVKADWEVLHGDPVPALTAFLKDRRDVLVVMATRAQPALKAAVLGSVTSGLMHRVSVPVVVQAIPD